MPSKRVAARRSKIQEGRIVNMNTQSIIDALDAEIVKLKKVRGLLALNGKVDAVVSKHVSKNGALKKAKKRILSPEARAKIAEGQRKRWAAARKNAK